MSWPKSLRSLQAVTVDLLFAFSSYFLFSLSLLPPKLASRSLYNLDLPYQITFCTPELMLLFIVQVMITIWIYNLFKKTLLITDFLISETNDLLCVKIIGVVFILNFDADVGRLILDIFL